MIRFQPAPPAPTPTTRCFRSLTERLADDMRELAFADQNVSEQTLVERGWTLPTLKRLAPDAISLARRLSVRQVA